MEGIVAKRTLKKSYYNNRNINNVGFETIAFNRTKEKTKKEKNKFETYKAKLLFKVSIQTITVISIIAFVLGIKLLKINVVLEADITKKVVGYYQKNYSFNQIIDGAKSLAKSAYIFAKPIIPKDIEDKAKKLYKVIVTKKENMENIKETNNEVENNEVKVYEESSVNNKENTVKENVGVSADINETKDSCSF